MLPLDGENWNTDITTKHFYRVFGVYIGILVLHDLDREIEYSYLPQYYFDQLYKRIDEIKGRNYKALEKILKRFYPLKIKAKREIPKLTVKNFKTLTNKQLASIFKKNRSWAHLITTYDQFGWTAENYWEPYMDNVLANKLGIEKDSNEYHRVLFALTKPAEISTTLEEKRDSILEAWKIKTKKKTIK